MVKEVYDWNTVANSNNYSPTEGGFPENMDYRQVNDAARELIAQGARWRDAIAGAVLATGAQPAYAITVSQTIPAYAAGQVYAFTAHADSTGAVTLKVNTLGAIAVKDSRGNQLGNGDVKNGGVYRVMKTASEFRVIGHMAAVSMRAIIQDTLNRAYTTTHVADAYSITTDNPITAYAAGQLFAFTADFTNTTGAPTLNADAVGAGALQDAGGAALGIGTIVSGQTYLAGRTASAFRVIAGLAGAGDVTGPAGATDGHAVLFNGATGKVIKSAGAAPYVVGGTDVAVADGGTGSSTSGGARTNLGLVIGTDVQAFDAQLADVAGLTPTKGNLITGNGSNYISRVVGSDGQVLTADSAQADGVKWAVAGGGITTIASGSFAAANSQVFATGILATFSYLVLEIIGLSSNTSGRHPLIQVSTDNGVSYDTNAANYFVESEQGAVIVTVAEASVSSIGENASSAVVDITCKFSGYQGGPRCLVEGYCSDPGGGERMTQGIYKGSRSAINALRMIWNGTGNSDAGTWALYGIS